MEPVTHMLTGAVLARAGLHKHAAYATLAMTIAAEFPDVDIAWRLRGPLTEFEHHRGITHTFLAVPFEAALLTAAFWAVHRWRGKPATHTPVGWGWLYGGTLLALLSHLLLDWTNNYGIRPFFPFDPHWFAGSFVFIFEPILFAILVAALALPGLFGLINSEVGARTKRLVSPGWSYLALLLILALYVFRYNEHTKALQLAAQNTPGATSYFASPHPGNPFVWSAVTETPEAYQLSTIDTRTGETSVPTPSDMLYKPATTLALLRGKRSELGQIYLDWSKYPVLTDEADDSDPGHPLRRIGFADARFFYDSNLLTGRAKPPLGGYVLLDMEAPEGQRVIETWFDDRRQR